MTDPSVVRLRRLLERLLCDPALRRRFVEQGPAAVARDEADAHALSSVDAVQLESTARKICGDLLTRRHRGSPGLEALYEETLAAWKAEHPGSAVRTHLVPAFVASSHYAAYQELPTAGRRGLCIEEAFFRFLDERDVGPREVRRREYLKGLFRALAVQPRPLFRVPSEVKRLPRGYRLVEETADGPVLYAAIDGRLVCGAITPLIAEVLRAEGVAPRRAPPGWDACRAKLEAMGLLAAGEATAYMFRRYAPPTS